MTKSQEVWKELHEKGLLDEEGGVNWNVGNAVMNFARDMEKIPDCDKDWVMRLVIGFYGNGTGTIVGKPVRWTKLAEGLWQSKDNPALFSTDGGSTYYSCNDPEHTVYSSDNTKSVVNEEITVG